MTHRSTNTIASLTPPLSAIHLCSTADRQRYRSCSHLQKSWILRPWKNASSNFPRTHSKGKLRMTRGNSSNGDPANWRDDKCPSLVTLPPLLKLPRRQRIAGPHKSIGQELFASCIRWHERWLRFQEVDDRYRTARSERSRPFFLPSSVSGMTASFPWGRCGWCFNNCVSIIQMLCTSGFPGGGSVTTSSIEWSEPTMGGIGRSPATAKSSSNCPAVPCAVRRDQADRARVSRGPVSRLQPPRRLDQLMKTGQCRCQNSSCPWRTR